MNYMRTSFHDPYKANAVKFKGTPADYFSPQAYDAYKNAVKTFDKAKESINYSINHGTSLRVVSFKLNENLYDKDFTKFLSKPASGKILPKGSLDQSSVAHSIVEENEYVNLFFIELPDGFFLWFRLVIVIIKILSSFLFFYLIKINLIKFYYWMLLK